MATRILPSVGNRKGFDGNMTVAKIRRSERQIYCASWPTLERVILPRNAEEWPKVVRGRRRVATINSTIRLLGENEQFQQIQRRWRPRRAQRVLFFIFLFFYFFISLIADGPHHYHPACGHQGSSHLSPVHALRFLSRCKFSNITSRQPMNG